MIYKNAYVEECPPGEDLSNLACAVEPEFLVEKWSTADGNSSEDEDDSGSAESEGASESAASKNEEENDADSEGTEEEEEEEDVLDSEPEDDIEEDASEQEDEDDVQDSEDEEDDASDSEDIVEETSPVLVLPARERKISRRMAALEKELPVHHNQFSALAADVDDTDDDEDDTSISEDDLEDDESVSSNGSDAADDAEVLSNADLLRIAIEEAQNPKPDLFDKVWDKVIQTAEHGADVIAAKSEILTKNLEHGIQCIQAKSDAVDLAASVYFQKSEEFVMGRTKSVSDSVQQNSKKVSDSVQKGLDLAKAKTDLHSVKVSKSVEYAEKRAEAACTAVKGMADSTKGMASSWCKSRLPFRFGA